MRSSLVLLYAIAVTACAGTEGDVLRSTADASIPETSIPDTSSPETSIPDTSSPETSIPDTSSPETSTSDTRPPGDAAPPRPRPEPITTWQIQLSNTPLDTSVDVRVYTADIETPTSVIRGLHSAGRIVICYFSGGTMEPFRGDAAQFPPEALGNPLAAYPSERWVDVRNAKVRSIMQERMVQAARAECDGVHPSGLAAFLSTTGFDLSRADQVSYNRALATAAHAVGLSIGLVDGDAMLSQELAPDFDWTVVRSCLAANCPLAAPFIAARKTAFLIEYGDESRVPEVCPRAKDLGLSAIIKKNGNLDAFRAGCP